MYFSHHHQSHPPLLHHPLIIIILFLLCILNSLQSLLLFSSAQVTVNIVVLDINDNPPLITVDGSSNVTVVHVEVGEGQAPGQLVYVVVVSGSCQSILTTLLHPHFLPLLCALG